MTGVLVDTSASRRFFAGAPPFGGLAELLDEDGAVLTRSLGLGYRA